ncbi:hypothetical protein KIN20_009857 [Parelaphostrongylus tenuis]|uniref:Brf1 TBP-binding domain-containing protein n=1 Tax=Parelaphostrongylus tenuis TaxID=148309 RepID=A0AAD5QIG6_PARTN|nr:hypothetical protein KIN20_009857 [Parelaphostrongylus tenuis]
MSSLRSTLNIVKIHQHFEKVAEKAREEQLAKEAEAAARMEKDVIEIEEELERALEKKRREKFKHTCYAKMVAGEIDDPEVGVAEEALVRNDIMDSVYRAADSDEERTEAPDYRQYGPSLHSLGIAQQPTSNATSSPAAPLPSQDLPDGSLDLTGIDEEEIDTYILTESESAMKERFWMKLNGEFVKEMEQRRKEREEEKEKEGPAKKKRKRAAPLTQTVASASAVEAMEKIIHEKRLSNKVNYDILKEITHTASGLEPLKQGGNNSQVIANVNELVATLALDNITMPDESNTSPSTHFTHENMSKQERDIIRRNKPLKDPSALRVALKIEPTNESSDSPPPEMKPIPLSRSTRRIRVGKIKPNIRHTAMLRLNASHSSATHCDPSSTTSNGLHEHSTNSSSDKISEVEQHITEVKVFSVQAHKDGESMLEELQRRSRWIFSVRSSVNPVESSGNLLRRRRILAKPLLRMNNHKVSNGKEEVVSDQPIDKAAGTEQVMTLQAPEVSEITDSNSQSHGTMLRRGRRSLIKPCLPSSSASRLDSASVQNDDTVKASTDEAQKVNECGSTSQTDLVRLKRGRRSLIKPCLPPSSSSTSISRNASAETSIDETHC